MTGPVLLGLFSSVENSLGLNATDAQKDAERKARLDIVYNRAITGDASALECLRLASLNDNSADNWPDCSAVGGPVAKAYAGQKYLEAKGKLAASGLLITAGAGALATANAVNPGSVTRAATTQVKAALNTSIGGLPAWAVVALVVVGGYIILRKIRRR